MYCKQVDDNYILSIGIDIGGIEITKEEYDHIFEIVRSKPEDTDTTYYKLKTDLTWEEKERIIIDTDGEKIGEETLKKRISDLEEQNQMLIDCILEMADIIYA